MLQTETEFSEPAGHSAFSGVAVQPGRGRFCYNCDTIGHSLSECAVPKVTCDECGDRGHMTKHCYVRNDKPLPAGMDAAKKQRITDKRVAYKTTKAACLTTAECVAAVDAQICEDEDFLSAMARLDL